jgi:hypothetical protein
MTLMFWNFVRRFVVMAVVVPVAVAGARKVSDVVEARRGPSRGTRWLRQGADTVQSTLGRKKKQKRRFF